MKKLKEKGNGIILCLFELVVGVLLLIDPVGFTSGIIMVAGAVLMVLGLARVIQYFRESSSEAAVGQTLVKGLIALLAGAFCAFKTEWFLVTFPVLTIIYGVVILVTGIGKVQLAVDMLRQKNKKWFWAAINAMIAIVCAVVILRSPFASTAVLWVFTGISLVVEVVFDVITMVVSRRTSEEGTG